MDNSLFEASALGMSTIHSQGLSLESSEDLLRTVLAMVACGECGDQNLSFPKASSYVLPENTS